MGISYAALRRCQSQYFNPVHGLYNTTRNRKVKSFAETIKQLLHEGCTFRQIEEAIRKEGYNGASLTIRMYTTWERKLMKVARADDTGPVEKIERKWLIRLL